MVDVFEDERSIIPLSVCFFQLVKAFEAACEARHIYANSSGIHFRIIPSSWVSWEPSESIPAFTAHTKGQLAFDLYDMFPSEESNANTLSLAINISPCMALENPLPRSIPFEFSENPPSHLLLQNSKLHLAYSYNARRNWLVACWTDSSGLHQSTLTYPLKHQKLQVILQEIWETTLELLDTRVAREIRWHLCIVKIGVLLQDEISIWKDLFSTNEPKRANICIYVLSIDTKPMFLLDMNDIPESSYDPPSEKPSSAAAAVAAFQTPGTTPSTSAPTPDSPAAAAASSTAPPPLPQPDADPTARLTDATHQSWCLVFAHQPNTSHTIPYSPSLASGLLLKRRSASPTDPPVHIQVNLMHLDFGAELGARMNAGLVESTRLIPGAGVDSQQHNWNETLKEIMGMYRSLVLLARIRGSIGVADTRPLHVVNVERALEGLERLIEL